MINFLPSNKDRFFLSIILGLRGIFTSKRGRYKLAAVIDLVLILVIIIYGRQPAQRMISPLVSSINSLYSIAQIKTTEEVFAFAPGLAQNKFDNIDLEGLTILSFFDIPLTEDGEINVESRGYLSFKSWNTQSLFESAHAKGTKVFMTITLMDDDLIKRLLDHDIAQQRLFDQVVSEVLGSGIDGVTVDFEAHALSEDYQYKFTQFIAGFTQRLHIGAPSSILAVGVPNSASNNPHGLYNIEALVYSADKVFLMADNFIVPEVKNAAPQTPVFGYDARTWWNDLALNLNNFLRRVPPSKLVSERAWYGNGENYPLYIPNDRANPENVLASDPAPLILDEYAIERLVAGVPAKGREAARRNIPIIAKALESEGILDSNVFAYALATVEHETDETFAPIDEIYGRRSARRLGYEGGTNFFGRGFIQITHLRNYRKIGERIGMGDSLVRNPELASGPEIAAKILAAFFKDNNVANLASQGYFVAAREPINPDINARSVARLAMKYGLDQ